MYICDVNGSNVTTVMYAGIGDVKFNHPDLKWAQVNDIDISR